MEFRKYQHIERYGVDEVKSIEYGRLVIFPKLDGTNGSVWLDDNGNIQAGSRNRQLSSDTDNQGFYNYVVNNHDLKRYLDKHPNHRLFGEWLVPHSFKGYREDAWKHFYIFDVMLELGNDVYEYLPYEVYRDLIEEERSSHRYGGGLDYVIPICTMNNGSYDSFIKLLDKNYFLIKDGFDSPGEGIVIKNYDFKNRYGRTIWAKLVKQEFKELNAKTMGITELKAKKMVEEDIVEKYCTVAFVEKEYQKIINDKQGWKSQYIPELLGRVYSELIKEECWSFIKEFKQPVINFKTLNSLVVNRIKSIKSELFS